MIDRSTIRAIGIAAAVGTVAALTIIYTLHALGLAAAWIFELDLEYGPPAFIGIGVICALVLVILLGSAIIDIGRKYLRDRAIRDALEERVE